MVQMDIVIYPLLILHHIMIKNQMRVDATLRVDLEGNLEGDEGKAISYLIFTIEINFETNSP